MTHKLLACALALSSSLPAQQPPTPSPATEAGPVAPASAQHDFKVIALERSDSGSHCFVKATVDGTTSRFIVDSGAAVLFVVSNDLAAKIGTKLVREPSAKPGQAEVTGLFDNFFIGESIRIRKQTVPVTDLSSFQGLVLAGKPADVEGIVGTRFLKSIRGCFDFEKTVLVYPKSGVAKGAYRLFREKRGDLILPLQEGGAQLAFITIRLKGMDFEFLLDTASAFSTIEPKLLAELGLEAEKEPSGGVRKLERVVVPKVWLARQEFGAMEFLSAPSGAAAAVPKGARFGGVVGSRFLIGIGAKLDFDTYTLILPKAPAEAAKGK